MKKLSMAPYPSRILLCSTRKEFLRVYRAMSGIHYPGVDAKGTMVELHHDRKGEIVALIHASGAATLAHEFSHAILNTFERIGIDPREANGEPFCYMLSHLMEQAAKK